MLYILSSTVITTPGLSYDSEFITVERARQYVADHPWRSAIGHTSTAEIASALLGRDIPVSRDTISMADGDLAVCIKLRGRAPEGVILSREEVEQIGYDLVLLSSHDPTRRKTMERVAALFVYPDAPAEGEQPYGTRRRGRYPMRTHFVVRLPLSYGGGFVSVTQEWGDDAWSVTEVSPEKADEMTRWTEL